MSLSGLCLCYFIMSYISTGGYDWAFVQLVIDRGLSLMILSHAYQD
jgi:hypothetical protein